MVITTFYTSFLVAMRHHATNWYSVRDTVWRLANKLTHIIGYSTNIYGSCVYSKTVAMVRDQQYGSVYVWTVANLVCVVRVGTSHEPIQVIVQHIVQFGCHGNRSTIRHNKCDYAQMQKEGQFDYRSCSHALQCFAEYLVIGFDTAHPYAKLECGRNAKCVASGGFQLVQASN